MDKLTDKIAALPPGAPYFSLEFFPPKTQHGFQNLHARLARMTRTLRPLFVNITWGAGGSTSSKSLELAALTQQNLKLTTCLHLTCTNMTRTLIDETLRKAKELGIRNILALRGDPPRSEEYRDEQNPISAENDSNTHFIWAVDLVKYIRKEYGDHFCIGVAGYPEGHSDQSCPEYQSVEHDLPYLVDKTSAGADFIMTQLFYDLEAYQKYETRLREHSSGVFKTIPIIPGLMPIQSYQILRRTTKLSHAKLPTEMLARLDAVKGDDEAVKSVGVEILSEMVEKMKSWKSPTPRGFHFYTLNLEKVVTTIIERSDLISVPISVDSVGDDHSEAVVVDESDGFLLVNGPTKSASRKSSVQSQTRNRVVVSRDRSQNRPSAQNTAAAFEVGADESGALSKTSDNRTDAQADSDGEGHLGREATWDDYPNGRWGDARSPAYGEIDGYGVRLHVSAPEARRLWGYPVTTQDVSACFRKNLEGTVDSTPWSEEPLQAETLVIKNELLSLIDKDWWTVASQPAVGGVRSADPVFGWGPAKGFVFQKPFVEFFAPSRDWERIRKTLEADDQVTYFAGNAAGDFASSDESSINPVTWGVFAGKEIITPTIIEAVSFKAWLEEAFGIWAEWQRVYPPGSASSKFLESIRKDYWLINVIHHGYPEKGALWEQLQRA